MAIVSQGGPSVFADADRILGAYRGENGRKCAIGHLISDDYYSPSLEKNNVQKNIVLNAFKTSSGIKKLDPSLLGFLINLQEAHDSSVFLSALGDDASFFKRWAESLKKLCVRWDLTYPEELV